MWQLVWKLIRNSILSYRFFSWTSFLRWLCIDRTKVTSFQPSLSSSSIRAVRWLLWSLAEKKTLDNLSHLSLDSERYHTIHFLALFLKNLRTDRLIRQCYQKSNQRTCTKQSVDDLQWQNWVENRRGVVFGFFFTSSCLITRTIFLKEIWSHLAILYHACCMFFASAFKQGGPVL